MSTAYQPLVPRTCKRSPYLSPVAGAGPGPRERVPRLVRASRALLLPRERRGAGRGRGPGGESLSSRSRRSAVVRVEASLSKSNLCSSRGRLRDCRRRLMATSPAAAGDVGGEAAGLWIAGEHAICVWVKRLSVIICAFCVLVGLSCQPRGKPGPFEKPARSDVSQSGRTVVRHYERRRAVGGSELLVTVEVDHTIVDNPPGEFATRHASLCRSPNVEAVALLRGRAVWVLQYVGSKRIATKLVEESTGMKPWEGSVYPEDGVVYDATTQTATRLNDSTTK